MGEWVQFTVNDVNIRSKTKIVIGDAWNKKSFRAAEQRRKNTCQKQTHFARSVISFVCLLFARILTMCRLSVAKTEKHQIAAHTILCKQMWPARVLLHVYCVYLCLFVARHSHCICSGSVPMDGGAHLSFHSVQWMRVCALNGKKADKVQCTVCPCVTSERLNLSFRCFNLFIACTPL